MLIGYARVSTAEQDLTLQLDALAAAGCEKVFTDKASGTRIDRNGLAEALAFVREGDSLVVWKLDRLRRSMKGLMDLAADLDARKVAGRFFFNVMSVLAVMERDLIQERTMAGLEAAKQAGKVGGRKPAMTQANREAAQVLFNAGKDAKEVAVAGSHYLQP